MNSLEARVKALKTKVDDKTKAEKAEKEHAATEYANLKTDKERIEFIARRLGLTQEK